MEPNAYYVSPDINSRLRPAPQAPPPQQRYYSRQDINQQAYRPADRSLPANFTPAPVPVYEQPFRAAASQPPAAAATAQPQQISQPAPQPQAPSPLPPAAQQIYEPAAVQPAYQQPSQPVVQQAPSQPVYEQPPAQNYYQPPPSQQTYQYYDAGPQPAPYQDTFEEQFLPEQQLQPRPKSKLKFAKVLALVITIPFVVLGTAGWAYAAYKFVNKGNQASAAQETQSTQQAPTSSSSAPTTQAPTGQAGNSESNPNNTSTGQAVNDSGQSSAPAIQ